MRNLSILRPLNQPFLQYPYWIAQDNQFSYEEKGLLTNLLSFKDELYKSDLVHFASNGKRSLDRAWKGLIAKGILIAQRFKVKNRFQWSYTVNLEQLSKIPTVDYSEMAHRHGVSEEVARAIIEETLSMTQSSASKSAIPFVESEKGAIAKPVLETEKMPIPVIEIAKPVLETEKMPIPVIEVAKPVLEIEKMPIPVIEVAKPVLETEKMLIPVIEVAKPVLETEKMPITGMEMDTTLKTPTIRLVEMWLPLTDVDSFFNPFCFELEPTFFPAMEIAKPVIEAEKMPISEREPVIEAEKMPISEREPVMQAEKMPISEREPVMQVEKMPISEEKLPTLPTKREVISVEKPPRTADEIHKPYAAILLQDQKLMDYLRLQIPHFEITPEILFAFHKRLDMNEIEHPNYEKYAQHFRNWLPDFLKYQQIGHQYKPAKKNMDSDNPETAEKCGTNKAFNILRKKLQNPQSDYMTYQSWVIELSEITGNLSSADITYRKELLETQKEGKLKERYDLFKAKNVAVPARNR
jgi:hypothetical protein